VEKWPNGCWPLEADIVINVRVHFIKYIGVAWRWIL
jgi:hypothetical protein